MSNVREDGNGLHLSAGGSERRSPEAKIRWLNNGKEEETLSIQSVMITFYYYSILFWLTQDEDVAVSRRCPFITSRSATADGCPAAGGEVRDISR